MALTLIYRTTCDVCRELVVEEGFAMIDGTPMPAPKKFRVAGMDVCDKCWRPMADGMKALINSVELRRRFKPLKTRGSAA